MIIKDLPPTVIYELAAPSTSDEVIEEVVEKAKNGEKVKLVDVKELKRVEKELAESQKANEDKQAEIDIISLSERNVKQMYNDLRETSFERLIRGNPYKLIEGLGTG